MKNTKRLVALCLTAVLTMAGCSSESKDTKPSEKTSNTASAGQAGKGVPFSEFPEVKGAVNESPTITFPATDGPTGLETKVLQAGDGDVVGENDTLSVNYFGQVWNGEKFDSSFDRGAPATFNLNSVIKGWKQGLAGKHVGDRVLLVIPADLGYGEQGQGNIPPNSTLTFVVDILGAQSADPAKAVEGAGPIQNPPNGFPAQVTGELGKAPTIALTGQITQEMFYTVAEGAGAPIELGSNLLVHIVSVQQGDNAIVSSWDANQPEIVQAMDTGALRDLIGKRVGTRFVAALPAQAEGNPGGAIVVDVLAVF